MADNVISSVSQSGSESGITTNKDVIREKGLIHTRTLAIWFVGIITLLLIADIIIVSVWTPTNIREVLPYVVSMVSVFSTALVALGLGTKQQQ